MANNTFQDGDVVVLKSGGPKMTVQGSGDFNGYLRCVWFDKDDKPAYRDFLPSSLNKAEGSSFGPAVA